MKRTIATLCTLGAFFVLAGAGCQGGPEITGNSTPTDTTPAATTTTMAPVTDLALTAEATDSGSVKFGWTLPSDFDKTHTVRILHSAGDSPAFPGAYWYQFTSDKTEGTWANIPLGMRYFRVCEFQALGNKCLRYSNQVELEVK